MPHANLDTYALEQANKMARTELASYHKAREKIHREATKNLVLEEPKRDQKRKPHTSKK